MEKLARIEYLLNEEGRRKSLLAGGNGKEKQVIEVPVTPEIVELASILPNGDVLLRIGFGMDGAYCVGVPVGYQVEPLYYEPGWHLKETIKTQYFDAPQDVAALLAWEKARRKRISDKLLDEKEQTKIAKYEEEWRLREERRRREAEENQRAREQRERRNAEEAAKRAEKERQKAAWIEEHGSSRLKRAFKLGYKCHRMYIIERCAKELPGFIVDFDDDCAWDERKCPSEEALDLVEQLMEKGYDASVVWLTKYVDDTSVGDEDVFGYRNSGSTYPDLPCEAVIVRNYLDYHAVCIV